MKSLTPFLFDLEMRLTAPRMDPRRRAVVSEAQGRVLELGVGTGQNLRFYGPDVSVVGIEPDAGMLGRAIGRRGDSPGEVSLIAATGESLPFKDGVFDEVVATLVL